MRIAIVYDCLYPNTIGGAERWLRVLSERLGEDHEVTYVTRRQWDAGEEPDIPGVRVEPVSPGGALYTSGGRRRLQPPLRYGLGVFRHFLRHRRDYDVVHCVSYPFFGLIALRLALAGRGVKVYCEWVEYLTSDYWRSYAGRAGGSAGRLLQRLCLRLTPAAFVFSALVESRVREAGFRGELHRLTGLWADGPEPAAAPLAPPAEPLVLFVGRHVPDKRVTVLPDALLEARRRDPRIRAVILGEGPDRAPLLERISELGLGAAVDAPGFVSGPRLSELLRTASCLVSPSMRDGHGMAVVEAAAAGLPAVICEHPDNAAIEHVLEGLNGSIAPSAAAVDIADAILRVIEGGDELRRSTAAWFALHRTRLSMDTSIEAVRSIYEPPAAAPALAPAPAPVISLAARGCGDEAGEDPAQATTASARGATP